MKTQLCKNEHRYKHTSFHTILYHSRCTLFRFQISDTITNAFNGDKDPQSSVLVRALSLKYAIYCLCFVSVLAGGAFLTAGITIEEDRARVQAFCQGKYKPLCLNSNTFTYLNCNTARYLHTLKKNKQKSSKRWNSNTRPHGSNPRLR